MPGPYFWCSEGFEGHRIALRLAQFYVVTLRLLPGRAGAAGHLVPARPRPRLKRRVYRYFCSHPVAGAAVSSPVGFERRGSVQK